jgi:hypothetical protein
VVSRWHCLVSLPVIVFVTVVYAVLVVLLVPLLSKTARLHALRGLGRTVIRLLLRMGKLHGLVAKPLTVAFLLLLILDPSCV